MMHVKKSYKMMVLFGTLSLLQAPTVLADEMESLRDVLSPEELEIYEKLLAEQQEGGGEEKALDAGPLPENLEGEQKKEASPLLPKKEKTKSKLNPEDFEFAEGHKNADAYSYEQAEHDEYSYIKLIKRMATWGITGVGLGYLADKTILRQELPFLFMDGLKFQQREINLKHVRGKLNEAIKEELGKMGTDGRGVGDRAEPELRKELRKTIYVPYLRDGTLAENKAAIESYSNPDKRKEASKYEPKLFLEARKLWGKYMGTNTQADESIEAKDLPYPIRDGEQLVNLDEAERLHEEAITYMNPEINRRVAILRIGILFAAIPLASDIYSYIIRPYAADRYKSLQAYLFGKPAKAAEPKRKLVRVKKKVPKT